MIAFERFRKAYGDHVAVHELTLEVASGEVVALLGPNGSGKTTTLKATAGLIHPTSGRVLLGRPGRTAVDPGARELLSFLPQRVAFPESLTGREVVEFYRALRKVTTGRTAEVLKFASLNGSSDRAVGTYSGGMVQRLGLAVAALPDAPIFLLDEPTAALDPVGLSAFYDLVEGRARQGRTVLFTSHQLGDVERLADRFAVLVEGRLAAVLTQRELHERLSERGVMLLRLAGAPDSLMPEVTRAAPGAVMRGDELVVPGSPGIRAAALAAINRAGVEVTGITTQEGRLDTLYREFVGEAP
jgi:ABC-type multidrug transport system ATPase subunit